MKLFSKARPSIAFSVLLTAVWIASFCFAQNQPAPKSAAGEAPQIYVVQMVRAKLGMANEWQNLIKNEVVPALKRGGVGQYIVLSSETFGISGEFLMFRRISNMAELDGPDPVAKALGEAGRAALVAKLDQVTALVRTIGITTRPDLSILPTGYTLKLVAMTRASVAPGRITEYDKYAKEQLSLMGKLKVKGVLVARVNSGGNPNEFWQSLLFDSFADLDQLGAAYGKVAAEVKLAPVPAGVVTQTERSLWRYVPELSIESPAQKTTR